jgi:predicted nicotinamide N-methyase
MSRRAAWLGRPARLFLRSPRDPGREATITSPDPSRRPETIRFIRERLPLAPVPGVPEIRLHMARPSSGLSQLAGRRQAGFGPPYWAYPWGGGLALARHFLDRPETVRGRRVLDLGAGSGLVAIAAAKAGARAAIASDVDPNAIAALRLNAAANAVAIEAALGDLTGGSPPPVDLVAVGDLFYDGDLAPCVTAFLDRCLAAGAEALIGDPWRAFLPRARLRLIAEYRVADFGEAGSASATASAVFAFEAAPALVAGGTLAYEGGPAGSGAAP